MSFKHYIFEINPENVYATGDCHGQWNLLRYKIRESNIKDSVIIIAGDCGLGFEKEEYYKQVYSRLKKILESQNVIVILVRGNHDDPEYFDGDKINFPNLKAVPDYSVLSFSDYNILCIGGAISIDRMNRIYKKNRFDNKKEYWENEPPIYKPEVLDKIISSFNISTVITHSSPKFAPPLSKEGIENYIDNDINLISDVNKERDTLTKIYNHIIKTNKLINWIYGHFHYHDTMYSIDNVEFKLLDMFRTRYNTWDIIPVKSK